jgi:hypothetical protein
MEMMTTTTTTRRAMWLGLAAALSCGSASVAASDGLQGGPTGLVETVQRAAERYRDPADAEAQGWLSADACVSGPEEGAMGVHFIKGSILFDGAIDPEQPEALIYEVKGNRARLVGVEFIVIASQWHASNAAPPVIMGQQTHLVPAPNRYGLDAFYELHVWAFRPNVKGTFVDWNPAVSCAGFVPEGTVPTTATHRHDQP